jgi:hypothetical protein
VVEASLKIKTLPVESVISSMNGGKQLNEWRLGKLFKILLLETD